MTYISSTSVLTSVRQSVLQAQSDLAQAQTEVSSGQHADLGLALGARAGSAISVTNAVDSLAGFKASNAVASARLDTTAGSLKTMVGAAQTMAASLVAAATAGGSTAGLQASAQSGLGALIGGLNTSVAGQFVFGGINSGAQPLADYFASPTSSAKAGVDGAFQSAFGFAQTSADAATISGDAMSQFLDGAFADQFSDANWSAKWSSASDTPINGGIAPGQSATTSVSANAPGFRQVAEAYAMLGEFTGSTMSADAKAAVVAKAGALLASGIAALNGTEASVGATQAAISTANDAIDAQSTVLKGRVSDLESVDTYALSNRVTTLQTQLQASYELTSRLQSLSLVNFLS